MSDNHKAIEDYEHRCFKCLEEKNNITKYSLYRSNYGSDFDNNYTHLHVCEDCKPESMQEWFDEEPELVDYVEIYQHEGKIIDFVNTLPIEGQELFWNRCAYGACAYSMDSQDWIDMKLGTLPDETYEAYGMYSPSQIKAYEERFSTCNHPINITYNDNSKGCWCVFDAHGDYGQTTGANVSKNCFECKHYIPRNEPIKEMTRKEFDQFKAYYIGKLNYERLKHKFE